MWNTTDYNRQSRTEKILFADMCNLGLKPRQQYSFDNKMQVDFAFPEQKLVIELDGKQHETPEQKAIDKKRDNFLKSNGWTVVRYRAEDVHQNSMDYAQKIKNLVEMPEKANYQRTDFIPEFPKIKPSKISRKEIIILVLIAGLIFLFFSRLRHNL